jgi:PEP-CTERM motif
MSKLTGKTLARAAVFSAVSVGASLLSTGAFATVTDLGNLNPVDGGAFGDINPTGPVMDAGEFMLTLPADTAVSATIAVVRMGQFTPGSLWLYEGSPFTGTLLESAALTFSGSAYTASFSDTLGPGTYYAEITGTINSKLLGIGGTVTTLDVPEPSTWAMLALGFMGLGYAAFRRNTKREAPALGI